MSHTNQSQTLNVTAEQQFQGIVERVVFSSMTGIPCFVLLFINVTMLFTLRSKAVFRQTSRYVLLYNLLFADTAQMAFSQVMYILAVFRTILTYLECGFLNLFAKLPNDISPLTLLVMSLERYVAVCYPLRHASIITLRSTGAAICVVWSMSLLNVLTRVILMLNFLSKNVQSSQMSEVCSEVALLVEPVTNAYNKIYTYFVFLSASVTITFSYIGVMLAARSASTDKASVQKARNTLVLHLVQLGFTILSTLNSSIIQLLSTNLQSLVIGRIKNVMFVLNYILPRCLSSLIYGLRDRAIRPVLMYHLFCQMKLIKH